MLSSIFEQFVEESPISVMARVLMERIFCSERLDNIFETHATLEPTIEENEDLDM